jgi:hypothetical protein
MCIGGGIYGISQENEFIEVKHKKMPRVNRWMEPPAVSSQQVSSVKQHVRE